MQLNNDHYFLRRFKQRLQVSVHSLTVSQSHYHSVHDLTVLYSKFWHCVRPGGRPKKRLQDKLMSNLLSTDGDFNWESSAASQSHRRQTCLTAVNSLVSNRISQAVVKRRRHMVMHHTNGISIIIHSMSMVLCSKYWR